MSDSDDTDPVAVELTPQEWDVVVHALEEEMAQLAPPEGNWLGKYPGEEDAVAIGDVRGIRDRIDYGSRMNQRLHQWAYREFARMIEYKAKLAGITVENVNEAYTSQECPQCGHRQKRSGREYVCFECQFHGHRDVVGAANIRRRIVAERKYVGTEGYQCRLPGVMASPSGVRFRPHLRCSSRSRRKTNGPTGPEQPAKEREESPGFSRGRSQKKIRSTEGTSAHMG